MKDSFFCVLQFLLSGRTGLKYFTFQKLIGFLRLWINAFDGFDIKTKGFKFKFCFFLGDIRRNVIITIFKIQYSDGMEKKTILRVANCNLVISIESRKCGLEMYMTVCGYFLLNAFCGIVIRVDPGFGASLVGSVEVYKRKFGLGGETKSNMETLSHEIRDCEWELECLSCGCGSFRTRNNFGWVSILVKYKCLDWLKNLTVQDDWRWRSAHWIGTLSSAFRCIVNACLVYRACLSGTRIA